MRRKAVPRGWKSAAGALAGREDMTDFESQVLSDLSALKTQVHALIGVGQPGRLTHLEERVDRHEQTVQRMKGVGGLLGVAITVFHLALDTMKK